MIDIGINITAKIYPHLDGLEQEIGLDCQHIQEIEEYEEGKAVVKYDGPCIFSIPIAGFVVSESAEEVRKAKEDAEAYRLKGLEYISSIVNGKE